MKNIVVLVSGGGTNLQALIDAQGAGVISKGEIVLVLSNNADAYGLTRGENAGIKTAVVSNKADYAVQVLCKQYFDGLFDYAVGEQTGVQRKPAPDSVNMVLDKLKITRNNAVYIGDSDVDIDTARNAEMDCSVMPDLKKVVFGNAGGHGRGKFKFSAA